MEDNTKKARELLAAAYGCDEEELLPQEVQIARVIIAHQEYEASFSALSEKEQAGQVPDDAEWYVSDKGSQTVDISHAGWQLSLMLQADGQVGWAYRFNEVSGAGVGIERFAASFNDCVLAPAAGAVPDSVLEEIAQFLKDRDEALEPGEATAVERMASAQEIAAMLAAAKSG